MRRMLLTTGILWLVAFGSIATPDAGACSIDGIPSISANGHVAVLNTATASGKTLLSWSPFVFKQPFREGEVVRLSENRALLKGVLSPEGLRAPWRWVFGDGRSAVGSTTITHRYSRPGQYHVAVSAYYASFKKWLTFDSVGLTVRP